MTYRPCVTIPATILIGFSFRPVGDHRLAAPTVDWLTRRRYHYWNGRSGRAYVHGVFSPTEVPYFENSALVVIANHCVLCTIIDVTASGNLAALYFHGGELQARTAVRRQ